MAAKPPGGPPKAPAAPVGRAPAAPRVPIAPPTPRIPVEEAARAPITPDDEWDNTDVTRPHDAFLTRDDVRAIADNAVGAPISALRAGQDEIRARLGRIEERISLLERSALTPVAPGVRSPPPAPVVPPPLPVAAPVVPPPLPVAVAAPAPAAVAAPAPAPAAVAAPVAASSDPFGAVVVAAPLVRRPAPVSVDLLPEDMPFDGSRRRRRLAIVLTLFLIITVGTFIAIAMTSQMRAGH